MDVRAGVVEAGVAVAAIRQRCEVLLEPGIGKIPPAVRCIEGGVTGNTGGRDAVKRVGSVFNAGEQVIGFGDTQQVAWLGLRQLRGAPAQNRAQILLFQGAAHTKAVKVHGTQIL